MTTFAVDELTAFQLLHQSGTDSRAARAARVVQNAGDSDVLTLPEDFKLPEIERREVSPETQR